MEKSEYLDLYRQMVLIRRLEETAAELYQKGEIGGFLHLYIGQEAVSTGIVAARQPNDNVITAYRDHGLAINVGIPANVVMAELLGKATGCSQGKGGSMHMADVEKKFWGGHARRALICHRQRTGLRPYAETGAVTICYVWRGATNIGFFYEALNMSKPGILPVLWFAKIPLMDALRRTCVSCI